MKDVINDGTYWRMRKMGITFTDREIGQIENANEILKEKERNLDNRRNDRGEPIPSLKCRCL